MNTFSTNELVFLVLAFIVLAGLSFSILHRLFFLVFRMGDYKLKLQRYNDMVFESQLEGAKPQNDFIIKICAPFTVFFQSFLKPRNIKETDRLITLAGWYGKITGLQFKILSILIKLFGLAVFVFTAVIGSWIIGVIIFLGCFFLPGFYLSSHAHDNEKKLIAGFPQFVRVVVGFLEYNPLPVAVQKAIPHCSKCWQDILTRFCAKVETTNDVKASLEWLRNEAPIPVVTNFVDTATDTLDLGGSVREAFDTQIADVERTMQEIYIGIVNTRENLTLITSVLLLLATLAVVAYPAVKGIMEIL